MKLWVEGVRDTVALGLTLGYIHLYPRVLESKWSLFWWSLYWWIGGIVLYSSQIKYPLYLYRNRDLLDISLNIWLVSSIPILTLGKTLNYHSWYYTIFYLLAFSVIIDFLFYGVHRFLHLSWMYRQVHYIHHRKKIVHPLYAQFGHPIEIVLNALTVSLTNYVLAPSMFDLFLITALIITSNISSHTFPDHSHGLHHQHHNCNYGIIDLADYFLGTYRQL